MIGNLLNVALSVIPKHGVWWHRFKDMTTDARGRETAEYYPAVEIYASVQPVEARDYQQYGLDLHKQYFQIWASRDMRSVQRNAAPDRFEFAGMMLEAVGNTDWMAANGWRAALCVKI